MRRSAGGAIVDAGFQTIGKPAIDRRERLGTPNAVVAEPARLLRH